MTTKSNLDENESSWKKDQAALKEILLNLNRHFGLKPNATGLDYLARFDIELANVQSKLYESTKLKMTRIRVDADLWMKNIYQSKWMQAEDYFTKIIAYTTYIYTL